MIDRMCRVLGPLFVLLACLMAATPGHAMLASPVGAVATNKLWDQYKTAFVKPDGRVVDNVNGGISHSEGQGYGMVLAIAHNDRKTFERMFKFAETQLAVRTDSLYAWRYDARETPAVKDRNNASDGDLLIAWALLEAGKAGWGDFYYAKGLAILEDLKPLVREVPGLGLVLLPGSVGFIDDYGNQTLNPAYWVYPALERIFLLTNEPIWLRLAASGRHIKAQFAAQPHGLVPDWVVVSQSANAGYSRAMSSAFGYEAIRVPLYVLWSAKPDRDLAVSMVDKASGTGGDRMKLIELRSGQTKDAFRDPGYGAINALAHCAGEKTAIPRKLLAELDQNYYPATLQMLSLLAVNMRYPECL